LINPRKLLELHSANRIFFTNTYVKSHKVVLPEP
jgi:hypothetical protein